MILGNSYSEGIIVEQNLLEAFIWYSVAEMRGKKLAPLLRKGIQRKLFPEQLADSKKQIDAILARGPAGELTPKPRTGDSPP